MPPGRPHPSHTGSRSSARNALPRSRHTPTTPTACPGHTHADPPPRQRSYADHDPDETRWYRPARSHPALPTPSAQPATNPAYQEATRTPDHDPPNGTTSPYPILPTHQPHPQHPRRTIGNSLWKRIPTGKVDSNPSARAQRRTRERNARTATETGARPPAE